VGHPLPSIKPETSPTDEPGWRTAGLRYYSLNYFLRREFGQKVWKLSLDAGLGCPNRDGSRGLGGCIFCEPSSFSPSRRIGIPGTAAQLKDGITRLRVRHGVERFLAYFQPGTNTHAPVPVLRQLYQEALAEPTVVGLIVGTRPDCAGNEVLDLLAEFAERTWLAVEYGLQSIHNRSLAWINRGHDYAAFLDCVARSQARQLRVGAHVILGLPGESRDDMRATARELTRLGIHSVKLHNLHAVENTPLADLVRRGEVRLLGLDEYVAIVVDFLEQLSPACVVDRLSGDAYPDCLVGPAWCLEKSRVRQAIEAEFARRNSWQGCGGGEGLGIGD